MIGWRRCRHFAITGGVNPGMKLVNVAVAGEQRVGIAEEEGVRLLPREADGTAWSSTDDILVHYNRHPSWSELGPRLRRLAAQEVVPWPEVRFLPAVLRPSKILCIGLNYRRHAQETGSAIPEVPVVFSKFGNALTGHQAVVPLPEASTQVDYEAELVLVVGRRARNVAPDEALEVLAGYTAGNDVSARDLQRKTSQWLLGKSCDGFAPLGPWLVTKDAIADPDRLEISLERDGKREQHSNTADMIFSCRQIVAYLSTVWTLEPGDVIFTGTPEGVILGKPKAEQRWLAPGETTVVRIEGIGALANRFGR
jgi:2-keto-4-pentenoate hydratase/2-oxohepta-3-ene-1,7-dioic acid hydratase in catechol pathway